MTGTWELLYQGKIGKQNKIEHDHSLRVMSSCVKMFQHIPALRFNHGEFSCSS